MMQRFALFLSLIFVGAACATAQPALPTATFSAPTLAPSPTFANPGLYEVPPDQYIGISNPTAAAVAPESDLPPLVTPDATLQANQQPIEIALADGTIVTGEIYAPPQIRQAGVLLVNTRSLFWGSYPLQLHAAGYTVLNVSLPLEQRSSALPTLLSALANLTLPERLAVIAPNAYADAALAACAAGRCQAVALLSPVPTDALLPALTAYGNRPLLVAASAEDQAAFTTAQLVRDQALGAVFFQPLENAGSGADMLFTRPDFADLLLRWLHSLNLRA